MLQISYWNFVIGGIGVFVSVTFSPNRGKTVPFESKEMHYLGMALALIILPELVQVMMKCCSQYFFKNSSGILVGRAIYAIATFLLGLHLSFESMYFASGSEVILSCYRMIYLSTISFFLSYTHSSTRNVYLVTAINLVGCSLMCCSTVLANDQKDPNSSYLLVIILNTMSLYYLCLKSYKIWFKKHAYSYSHVLFIYFSLMTLTFAITLRVVIVLYYQDYSKYAPILIYVFQSINFAVIPGLIAEQDVIQSKDDLATTKSTFQRYIFHEMKSPLNSTIMGIQHCLSLIKEGTADPDMLDLRDSLLEVKDATDEGLKIMEDMLLIDKIENGKVVLHKEEVPIKSLIIDCLDMFKFQIKSKGVKYKMFNCANKTDSTNDAVSTITTDNQQINHVATDFTNIITSDAQVGVSDFVKDTDTINVDKAKWIQVYRNVLSNAIKFTPKDGTITLRVTYVLNEVNTLQNDNSTFDNFCILLKTYITKTSNNINKIIVGENQSQTTNHNICENSNAVDKMQVQTGMLVVEIHDSGAGISVENQARLFKEIVQFNPDKLQAGGGSGLGMFISKGIVDMHGGRISVHSDGEGKGTTFRIEIPMTRILNLKVCKETITLSSKIATLSTQSTLEDLSNELPPILDKKKILIVDDVDTNRKILRKRKSLTKPRTTLTSIFTKTATLSYKETVRTEISLSNELPPIVDKKKILIVDDVDSNRKMLRKLLTKRGHQCDEANDGTVAVDVVKAVIAAKETDENTPTKPYDVIFMDYMMRDMNGPEATRLIRSLGFTGLIIGATGNSLDNDQEFFMKAGLDDIIIKPLRMPEICRKVRL